MTDPSAIAEYWERVRADVPTLPETVPGAWAFGATPAHADALLALVIDGVKTGTASSLWDYEATGDPQPYLGEFSIILDGSGEPRAVIETTDVTIVPFDQVTSEHAHSEGEGDRTLDYWRASHERYWRAYSESPRGFAPDMPIICERFRVIHPR
jgi:histidinol-phosphate aminotransferase